MLGRLERGIKTGLLSTYEMWKKIRLFIILYFGKKYSFVDVMNKHGASGQHGRICWRHNGCRHGAETDKRYPLREKEWEKHTFKNYAIKRNPFVNTFGVRYWRINGRIDLISSGVVMSWPYSVPFFQSAKAKWIKVVNVFLITLGICYFIFLPVTRATEPRMAGGTARIRQPKAAM